MTLTQVILFFPIAVFANWQVVETWRHGSIFENAREWLEARPPGFFTDLLLCSFCLSHWTGAAITALLFLTMDNLNYTYAQVAFVYALGVTRLPQVLNDLGYSYWRKHSSGLSKAQRQALEELAQPRPAPDTSSNEDYLAKLEKELDSDVNS